ncbi:signal recognition particle protein [bacterium]|nr:signal recognition particle protein [bacterium]
MTLRGATFVAPAPSRKCERAVFETITETLTGALGRLTSRGKLTDSNIDEGLREVRQALLQADVAIPVVKHFIERVKAKAVGQQQIQGVDPSQQIVKVVHDELCDLMGPIDTRLKEAPTGPTVIMMVGLQGSGKTTTSGKLAKHLVEKRKKKPLLVAADLQRPAAIDQLKVLGAQLEIPVYSEEKQERKGITKMWKGEHGPSEVCTNGIKHAIQTGRDVVILDTAGRLHIDDELMKELREIKAKCEPQNIYLVCDAMTGQDAVNSARVFNEQLNVDGVILTKLDGDARGGAALSIKYVTGKTIKYMGVGEKLDALEEFHPDRMAGRILGMGDIVSLVNKAAEVVDQKAAEKSAMRLMEGRWNYEDFLEQLRTMKKFGPLKQVIGMIPFLGQFAKDIQGDELKPFEAILCSMTKKERRTPDLLGGIEAGSRRRRIANGSGTSIQEVNQFIKTFKSMQRVVTQLTRAGPQGLAQLMTKGGMEKVMPQLPGGKTLGKMHGPGKSKKNKRR